MEKSTYLEIRKKNPFTVLERYWAAHLFTDGLLVALIYEMWQSPFQFFKYFTAIPLAALIFRGFGLMHEAVHGVVSKSKAFNDFLGLFYGAVCLLPYEPWKKSHLEHHYWSGNYQKDPVMALLLILPKKSNNELKMISRFWNMWIPYLAFLQQVVFWKISFLNTSKTKSFRFLISLLAPIAMWGVLLAWVPFQFVVVAVFPALFLYLVAVEVVNFPHHLQMPMMEGDHKLPIWEQHKTARTCLYPRWVARILVLNFNFHSEHHMFPDSPWYYLEQIHQTVNSHLGASQQVDPMFTWILENRPKSIQEVARTNEKVSAEIRKNIA